MILCQLLPAPNIFEHAPQHNFKIPKMLFILKIKSGIENNTSVKIDLKEIIVFQKKIINKQKIKIPFQ